VSAGRIVFESNRTGNSDIWIAAPDGTKQRNLTGDSKVDDLSPALSPDGSLIAFARVRRDRSEIWLMNANGTDQHRLGVPRGSETHAAWSPSGDRLAFVTLDAGRWDVVVATLKGVRRRITNDRAAQLNVTWSSKGDRLVFDRIEKGTSNLWSIPAKGGRSTQLTRSPGVAEMNPAHSPVADEVAYDAADAKGRYDLYVLDLNNRRSRRVTHDAADDGDPTWSPDGSRLAYRRGVGADYEIARISASGQGRPFNVSRDPGGLDLSPSWQGGSMSRAEAYGRRVLAISPMWIFWCDERWPGKDVPETLYGTDKVNHMCGGGKADTIRARPAGDFVSGGTGNDVLRGEDGGDWLKARDYMKDLLYGGSGYDHGLVDASDFLDSVEAPES
jgi:Tol biopolymer transport system component